MKAKPLIVALCVFVLAGSIEPARALPPDDNSTLVSAVLLMRHGVRSPTSTPEKLAPLAARQWPAWSVPPGYLTVRGKHNVAILGTYYRAYLAHEGLFQTTGCDGGNRLAVDADSDERTRETAAGFLDGFAPSCHVTVVAQAEGVRDSLFHPQNDDSPHVSPPANVLAQLQPEFAAAADVTQKPSALKPTRGLANGATIAENLQLEYEEGFTGDRLGWGRLTEANLFEIMRLHVVSFSLDHRNPVAAAASATPMLNAIRTALLDRSKAFTLLVGHDSNVAAVAQMLGLHWSLPGYQSDDTPPGGGLLFELRKRTDGSEFVLIAYVAQSLDQMRNTEALTLETPPERSDLAICAPSLAPSTCRYLQRAGNATASPYGD